MAVKLSLNEIALATVDFTANQGGPVYVEDDSGNCIADEGTSSGSPLTAYPVVSYDSITVTPPFKLQMLD